MIFVSGSTIWKWNKKCPLFISRLFWYTWPHFWRKSARRSVIPFILSIIDNTLCHVIIHKYSLKIIFLKFEDKCSFHCKMGLKSLHHIIECNFIYFWNMVFILLYREDKIWSIKNKNRLKRQQNKSIYYVVNNHFRRLPASNSGRHNNEWLLRRK